MSLNKIHEELKKKYPKYLVLIRNGNFYDALDEDGKILHIIQDYKFSNNRSGFPVTSFVSVSDRLDLYKINYLIYENKVIHKNEYDNNSYDYFLNKSIDEEKINNRRVALNEEVEKLLKYNQSNYDNLLDYLKKLNSNIEIIEDIDTGDEES